MVTGTTRERIEATAIRLFNDRGTAAVSTNHIAEGAGISPGNLYYHFRNKEEIIRVIFERMIASWVQVYAVPQDRASSLTDLERILEETFSVLWEYRFVYRELVALMRRDHELWGRYQAVRERGLVNTDALLTTFVESGVLREPADRMAMPRLATILWLITEFWLPFAELGGEKIGAERTQECVELLIQVLLPYLTEEAVAEPGSDRQGIYSREDKS